jgi:hypothetical protein
MSEQPENFWTSSWRGPRGLLKWYLVLAIAIFCFYIIGGFILHATNPFLTRLFISFVCAVIFGLIGTLLIGLLQMICAGNFKPIFFGAACLITLVALLYAEEDVRGKYDWDQFKHQWEAKGESFDRESLMPPAVPDEQNFAMSPVWIAEEKYIFQKEPDRAEAWYGGKIYDEDVSNFFQLLPCNTSDVTGANWASHLPVPPQVAGQWAMARMTDLQPLQAFYRNLEEVNREADIRITAQPQSPAADVLLALSKYDPMFDQLRKDSALPYSRFPVKWEAEDPASILLPHLSAVKSWSQVLQLRAIAELQDGQSDQALADIKLMLRLAESIHTEPTFISQLVRIAVLQIALQPVYEGLARHQWSDAQLAELDSELASLDFVNDYRLALHSEVVLFEGGIFDLMRRHPAYMFSVSDLSGERPTAPLLERALAHLIPEAWFYQNQLSCARGVLEYDLPAADTNLDIISPTVVKNSARKLSEETKHVTPYNGFERMLLPELAGGAQRFACAQNSANMARVAIALERYYLAHGQFPETPDVLSPHYLQDVPHDIINGQPLHYRPTSDGRFILYSVGWNEEDDGGKVAFKGRNNPDNNHGDWVWQYPTK